MNNDTYRTIRKDIDEETEGNAAEARLAISLARLIRNRDWKIVCEDFLMPRMTGARERADTLEGAELFRFQGEIRVLKILLNLQTALDAQQNTIAHAQETDDEGF